MKCRKVAVITPFLANGGLEKVAITGAEELSKYFDVTLIVMDSFHIDYHYSGKIIDLEVSLMNRGIFKRLYNIIMSTVKLKKLKKEYSFDIVISHGELANLPNVFSGGKSNILTVHENRFAALKDAQGKLVNKMIKYIYSVKSISKIVTVSEGIMESFIQALGLDEDKLITIYNPYEIDKIKNLAMEDIGLFSPLFTYPVLMTAGRLTMAKGQWYLLRIFKELKKTDPMLKLVILGEGEMRKELIELSGDLGLKTFTIWSEDKFSDSFDVYFMGFQKNPFKFIQKAKVFAMTSLWEGFGGTLVEAMASSTPVISTDCKSGPGEIIYPKLEKNNVVNEPLYDGFGVLMPIFKSEFITTSTVLDEIELLWVETLETLLQDEEKLSVYVESGLIRAEKFRIEMIMGEWKRLIDSSLGIREKGNSC